MRKFPRAPVSAEILIVEDESLVALDLKQKLEQVGYIVPAIVDNADEALDAVECLSPSLVLMDIRLRGPRDGVEAADQIRRRFHLPVVFLTAYGDRETLDRARIAGPFGYVLKPFVIADLQARIEVARFKHKLEKKLRDREEWLSSTLRYVAED